MIKTNLLLVVLASAFAFAGCKKEEKTGDTAPKTTETATDTVAPADPPVAEKVVETAPATEGEMSREEVAEKAVSMFSKMNEVVKAGNGDCEKIAAEFTTLITEFKPVMEAGKKFEEDPANKKWFEDTYGEKVKAIMGEMMGNMGECMTDPAIQKAFESMEE